MSSLSPGTNGAPPIHKTVPMPDSGRALKHATRSDPTCSTATDRSLAGSCRTSRNVDHPCSMNNESFDRGTAWATCALEGLVTTVRGAYGEG